MPRIRSIKPEFWSDSKMGRLSPTCRLLYIGLWTFADDNGICEEDPYELKALIFPYDSVTGEDIQRHLNTLVEAQRLMRFARAGKRYLLVTHFSQHQNPKNPSYKHPLPDPIPLGFSANGKSLRFLEEHYPSPTPALGETYPKDKDEDKDKERDKEGRARTARAPHSKAETDKTATELAGTPAPEGKKKSEVERVLDRVAELAGYPVPHFAKEAREVKKALRQEYTLEQITTCWNVGRQSPRWRGTWFPFAYVLEDLGEFVKGGEKPLRRWQTERRQRGEPIGGAESIEAAKRDYERRAGKHSG